MQTRLQDCHRPARSGDPVFQSVDEEQCAKRALWNTGSPRSRGRRKRSPGLPVSDLPLVKPARGYSCYVRAGHERISRSIY